MKSQLSKTGQGETEARRKLLPRKKYKKAKDNFFILQKNPEDLLTLL